MTDNPYRPNAATLRKVIAYLEELGLSVYGQHSDLETGLWYHGCRDYSAEDVLRLRDLLRRGKMKNSEEMEP